MHNSTSRAPSPSCSTAALVCTFTAHAKDNHILLPQANQNGSSGITCHAQQSSSQYLTIRSCQDQAHFCKFQTFASCVASLHLSHTLALTRTSCKPMVPTQPARKLCAQLAASTQSSWLALADCACSTSTAGHLPHVQAWHGMAWHASPACPANMPGSSCTRPAP